MAKFTHLPNELIITIASHIRKPAHILHLVLLNHRTHDLIIPLLYQHIILHSKDYPCPRPISVLTGHRLGPIWNIRRLCARFTASPALRSEVHTFEIGLDAIDRHDFSFLLTQMNSLKRLRILRDPYFSEMPTLPEMTFDFVSKTVESLDLGKCDFLFCAHGNRTSFSHFTALKHLSIQSANGFRDYRTRRNLATLRGYLPVCLQELELYCQGALSSSEFIGQCEWIAHLLVDLMKEGLTTPRPLQTVTLYLKSWRCLEIFAKEPVQKMSEQFDLCTAQLNQQGIKMDAKVRFVMLEEGA